MKKVLKRTKLIIFNQRLLSGCLLILTFVGLASQHKIDLFINRLNQTTLSKERSISVTQDQQFMLTVSLAGDDLPSISVNNIKIEGVEDFELTTASKSKTRSFTDQGSFETYDFHYYLQPKSTGSFRIGPASCNINNKTYKSPTIDVEVATTDEIKDFFATISIVGLDKQAINKLFVGQQAYALITLYANKNSFDSIEDLQIIPPEGSDLEIDRNWQAQPIRDEHRGKKHYAVTQFFMPIVALQGGQVVVMPFKINCKILQRGAVADWPFLGFLNLKDVTCMTNDGKPIAIEVVTIPPEANAVADKLNMKLSLQKNRFNLGEPINLTVEVNGKGDFDKILHPDLELPPNIKSYQSNINHIKPSKKDSLAGIEQIKQFEYILQTSQPGIYKIPAQSICYFNSTAGELQTATTEPLSFYVSQDGSICQPPTPSTPAADNAKNPATKPVTSHTQQALIDKMQELGDLHQKQSSLPVSSYTRWLSLGLLLSLLLLLLLMIFYHEIYHWVNQKLTHRLALIRAKLALKKAATKHNPRLVYDIILSFFAARFGVMKESITLENLADLTSFMDSKEQTELLNFIQYTAAIAFGIEKLQLQKHEEPVFFQQAAHYLAMVDTAYLNYLRKH